MYSLVTTTITTISTLLLIIITIAAIVILSPFIYTYISLLLYIHYTYTHTHTHTSFKKYYSSLLSFVMLIVIKNLCLYLFIHVSEFGNNKSDLTSSCIKALFL